MAAAGGGSEVLNQVLATLQATRDPVTPAELQTLLRLRYGSERSMKEIMNRLQYGVSTRRVQRKMMRGGESGWALVPGTPVTQPQAKLRTQSVDAAPRLGDPIKPKVADPAKAVEAVKQLAELGVSSVNLAGDVAAAVKACEDVAAEVQARDADQVEAEVERIRVGVELGPLAAGDRPLHGDAVNAPAGLRDRLKAIHIDIEDAIGDACDAELAHRLIKSLVASGAAVRRALAELPA